MTLKPCPFCDSDRVSNRGNFIQCVECEASGPTGRGEKHVTGRWNRRAPSPAFVAMRELIEWLREESPVDFLGTGSNIQKANQEQAEWERRIEAALQLAESETKSDLTTQPNPKP
jgi:hypothetical protein